MTADFINLPFKAGGDTREGLDCRGLVLLWLREREGLALPPVPSHAPEDEVAERVLSEELRGQVKPPAVGDVCFFRERKTGKVRHVGIWTNDGLLHQIGQWGSRVDRGFTLVTRTGYVFCGALPPTRAQALALALSDGKLGDFISPWILLAISVALSAASAFLMPKPKLGQFRNESGRYGFDNLATQSNPQLPLPDILGAVTVSGNSPYQSLIDKSQPASDATQQKINKVVILGSGPFTAASYLDNVIKVNGRDYRDTYWHPSGIKLDPAQSKAEAVDGEISSEHARPSVSVYLGTHGISVPVDIRAQYDRNFPIYGFSGCAYLVFRLIDSAKFPQFNLTCTPKGRSFRTFNSSGFITATSTSEAVGTGDGSTVRFKLDYEDIASISTVTVGGTTYTESSEDQPAGKVYRLNRLKGYLEFFTAPAGAAAVVATYTYYVRAWSQNPAVQTAYLLTEEVRGKGFDEDKLDWAAFAAEQTHNAEEVLWAGGAGQVIEARNQSDYAVDARKPVQEHLRALRDAAYGYLFLSNGKFVAKARTSGSSVFSFTTANILRDSFSAELMDRSGLANRVRVNFRPLATYNAEASAVRENEEDQRARADFGSTDGVAEETLQMEAVTRESHAERLAEQALRENVGLSWVCQFTTTTKGLALEPGDIVDVTHFAKPSWSAKLFRIEDISLDSEDRLKLTLSEHSSSCYI